MRKKANHPQWALDQKRPGTELRCIRGSITCMSAVVFTTRNGFSEDEQYQIRRVCRGDQSYDGILDKTDASCILPHTAG